LRRGARLDGHRQDREPDDAEDHGYYSGPARVTPDVRAFLGKVNRGLPAAEHENAENNAVHEAGVTWRGRGKQPRQLRVHSPGVASKLRDEERDHENNHDRGLNPHHDGLETDRPAHTLDGDVQDQARNHGSAYPLKEGIILLARPDDPEEVWPEQRDITDVGGEGHQDNREANRQASDRLDRTR